MKIDRAAVADLLQEFGNQITQEAAEAGAGGARRRAPVDTGRLRDSIKVVKTRNGYAFGSDLDYAIHQEFGTRWQPGTPFIRPGLDDARRKLS